MKILLLTRHSRMGATSRIRHIDHIQFLESNGHEVVWQPFFRDSYLTRKYLKKFPSVGEVLSAYLDRWKILRKAKDFDAIWMEKESLPLLPAWMERRLLPMTRTIIDMNDAWHFRYNDEYPLAIRLLARGKIEKLVAAARAVTVPNHFLLEEFQFQNENLWLLEGPVDVDKYSVPRGGRAGEKLRVGWIGTPWTAERYLAPLVLDFNELIEEGTVEMVVIGAGKAVPHLLAERHEWSVETEALIISSCNVGILPLNSDPFVLGKSSYKALQFMAAGCPVVVSDVGQAPQVAAEGRGHVVKDATQWKSVLRSLSKQRQELEQQGALGRDWVMRNKSYDLYRSRLTELLRDLAKADL